MARDRAVAAFRLLVRPASFGLPQPVQREVAAVAGGRIFLAGGLNTQDHSVNGVFALDPSTGALTSAGTVPQPFHDAAGALIGSRLVVFGGGTAQSSDAVQAFDLAGGGGRVIGRLPKALSDLSSATVDGTVYLVGGYDGVSPQRTIYATADGTHFRSVGTLPVGLRYAAVAASGSSIVIAGGVSASGPVASVERFDPASGKVTPLGSLPAPVGHASAFALGGHVYVAGGQDAGGRAVRTVSEIDAAARRVHALPPLGRPLSDAPAVVEGGAAWLLGGWRGRAVGQVLMATEEPLTASPSPDAPASVSPPGTGGVGVTAAVRPFAGLLLIADRGNNRLLVMTSDKRIVWRYPSPDLPPPPHRFYFPDDAFWVHDGHAILVNEEENDVLIEIAYPSGRVLWSYGHPGVPGSAPGYLWQPDDVYPLPRGGVVVADAKNCRILFFDAAGHPVRQIGRVGQCVHSLPGTVGYPNGDTPLPGGDFLLSELNGAFIDEVRPNGDVVWSHVIHGIGHNPSDPQQLADGSFLAVAYDRPGRVVRFTAAGKVLWSYGPASGPGELDHPSLGAPLPNGLIAVNDDYRHRVILIDPAEHRIVWQYGVTDRAGTSNGHLSYPDGLDLLLPGGIVPLHVDFPGAAVTPGRP